MNNITAFVKYILASNLRLSIVISLIWLFVIGYSYSILSAVGFKLKSSDPTIKVKKVNKNIIMFIRIVSIILAVLCGLLILWFLTSICILSGPKKNCIKEIINFLTNGIRGLLFPVVLLLLLCIYNIYVYSYITTNFNNDNEDE